MRGLFLLNPEPNEDMCSSFEDATSPLEAADDLAWLIAHGPTTLQSGRFWRHREEIAF